MFFVACFGDCFLSCLISYFLYFFLSDFLSFFFSGGELGERQVAALLLGRLYSDFKNFSDVSAWVDCVV